MTLTLLPWSHGGLSNFTEPHNQSTFIDVGCSEPQDKISHIVNLKGFTITVERWGISPPCIACPKQPPGYCSKSLEKEKSMKHSSQLLSHKGMHLCHLNCSCFLEPHQKIVQAQAAEILICMDRPKFKKDELLSDLYKQLRRKSLP